MTSDPAAPNAPAVFLNYDEYMDVPGHFDRYYGRIKILTQKGVVEFGDVRIPYPAGVVNVRALEGRTIHSDGTVIPFAGQPYDKEIVKAGGVKEMEKVFSLPDVQVGSIIEYRFEIQYDDRWIFWPEWYLQQPIFVHEAHYHFIPAALDVNSTMEIMVPDPQGKQIPATRLQYDAALPPGAKLQDLPSGMDLTVKDIPPIPDEPDSPPLGSFSYRLFYYYTGNYSAKEFWTGAGNAWSKSVDHFAEPSDAIRQAVGQIVSPGDTDAQKLEKIYAAVMTIENTRYSRERSQEENKAEGVKVLTAADVWSEKRGTPNQITRLFIAMARAAGMNAYAMAVTERDKSVLNANYLNWHQLTDEIAIVAVGGKEVYFDPGERYCEYGKLAWKHTQVLGMRQTASGTEPVLTPAAEYKDNEEDRMAGLQLGPDGKLLGEIKISMTGAEALRWRQQALTSDEEATKTAFDRHLQGEVPPGVVVKTRQFTGLTDDTQPLVAIVDVSGGMGTAAGKRVIFPGTFFEASAQPRFAAQTRENPVDLRYPYLIRDQVKVTLAPGLTVTSVPNSAQIPFPQNAEYIAKYGGSGNTYQQARLLAVGNTLYKKEQYPDLRDFFQKVDGQDKGQVVLDRTAAGSAQAGTAAGANQ